jgi:glycerol-3-phosphate dehydrogenase
MGKQEIKHFSHIIIGGGIVGAGVFRDLALHNESVLLLDKGDFNSQTSQSSSKMLHGGIRYLENMDVFLVKEALFEKNHWLKVAPHLAQEQRFYLPIYKESKYPLWMLRAGLHLYDLLSGFNNTPHQVIDKKQTLEQIPGIKEQGLKGAGIYSDGVVDDSKLGLECIYDGLNNKLAQALNYHEVRAIHQSDSSSFKYTIEVTDNLTNQNKSFTCDHVIVSVGPFTDRFMQKMKISWDPVMLLSKGSHLWIKKEKIQLDHPMVLQTKDQRIIFVIPQRDAILVGTTEVELDENEEIFNIQASEEEINYLLENVNEYFPNAHISPDDILNTYCGVRPLVKSGTSSSKTSRNHKIYKPLKNFLVICGGKYTTFRVMAKEVTSMAMENLNRSYNPSLSLSPFQTTSIIKSLHDKVNKNTDKVINDETLLEIIEKEKVRTIEDLVRRRLSVISNEQLTQSQLESIKKASELIASKKQDKN